MSMMKMTRDLQLLTERVGELEKKARKQAMTLDALRKRMERFLARERRMGRAIDQETGRVLKVPPPPPVVSNLSIGVNKYE